MPLGEGQVLFWIISITLSRFFTYSIISLIAVPMLRPLPQCKAINLDVATNNLPPFLCFDSLTGKGPASFCCRPLTSICILAVILELLFHSGSLNNCSILKTAFLKHGNVIIMRLLTSISIPVSSNSAVASFMKPSTKRLGQYFVTMAR